MDVRNKPNNSKSIEKVHQWRKCGKGKHLVQTHTVHTHAILALRINHQPFNPKPMVNFREYYQILKQE